jgi:hypothetical protein
MMWCSCSKVLSEGTSRRRQIGGWDPRRVIFSPWTVDPGAFPVAGLIRLVFAMTPSFPGTGHAVKPGRGVLWRSARRIGMIGGSGW